MKTTKLTLIIILVALTATSFGQLSFKERLFSRNKVEVAYYTADYKTEKSMIENWMYDLQSWASEKVSWSTYEAPIVSQEFALNNAEMVYEESLILESWMYLPFEAGVVEEELEIETWMAAPFEDPDAIEIEDWMTTIWI